MVKFYHVFFEIFSKYWCRWFLLSLDFIEISEKLWEIPDLSKLWTDFKDIIRKNLENSEYPLLQTLKKKERGDFKYTYGIFKKKHR